MQTPTTTQPDEFAEHAPRYLDQFLESRDHANQWDVSTFWQPASRANDAPVSTLSVGKPD